MPYSRQHPDHYETLGLPEDASFPQIEAAYWQRARQLRRRELDLLNEAYEVLSSDRRRQEYDEARRGHLAERPEPKPAPGSAPRPRPPLLDQFGAR